MQKIIDTFQNDLNKYQNTLNVLKATVEGLNNILPIGWEKDFFKTCKNPITFANMPIIIDMLECFKDNYLKKIQQQLDEAILRVALLYRCPYSVVNGILKTYHNYDIQQSLKEKTTIEVINDLNEIVKANGTPVNITIIIKELQANNALIRMYGDTKFVIRYADNKVEEVGFIPNDYESYTTAICTLDNILKKQIVYNKKNQKIKVKLNNMIIEGTISELQDYLIELEKTINEYKE